MIATKPLFAGVGLLAGAALLSPAPASTQEPAALAAPSLTISGFEGIPWGIDREAAISALGQPLGDRTLENGLYLLAWRDELVNQPSVLLFGFLPDLGFVKAQEIVDLEEAGLAEGDCIEFIRDIHHEVDLRYPLIRPSERAKNNTPESICEAAADSLAFWYRQWRDAETGSVVTVGLGAGATQVELTYESLAFRDWIAAAGGEAVPLVDDGDEDPGVLEAID